MGAKARGKAAGALLLALVMIPVGAVRAEAAAPALSVTSSASPTHLVPGSSSSGVDFYSLVVTNVGDAPTDGSPITISDALPSGIVADPGNVGRVQTTFRAQLDANQSSYQCDPGPPAQCVVPETLTPGQRIFVYLPIDVDAGLDNTTVTNHVSVSGGGAPDAFGVESTLVSTAAAPRGFRSIDTSLTDSGGAVVSQAGSHPSKLGIDFLFNTISNPDEGGIIGPVAPPRYLTTKLPAGLVVDPSATPARCTEAQLEAIQCPLASAIGLIHVNLGFYGYLSPASADPIYNMVPPPGVPASLGFEVSALGFAFHIFGGVDSAGDYSLTAHVADLPQFGGISGASVELWGDPSDPIHDNTRGNCLTYTLVADDTCPVDRTDTPLLTMPSACSGPLATSISVRPWQDTGNPYSATALTQDGAGNSLGVTGCQKLGFAPTISILPDTSVADSPTGLDVDLKVPQATGNDNLATANLKDAVVTLPAGMAVSASAADGLAGCSTAQIGMHDVGPVSCPDGSKIGTVRMTTPLLTDPLEGAIYLAAQNDNPSHSVLGLYIVAEGSGVRIKLPGHVRADPATGQLTATFADNPQLPFDDLKLHFTSGSRAPLATPDACGSYATTTTLSPWSGTPAVNLSNPFVISSGCDGGFSPAFNAGVGNPSAATSSTFTLNVSRADGQQHFKSITTTLPPGLLAKVGSVALCADADAAAGTCDAGSQVGSTDAAAGPGTHPFHVPGKVYLTGPYMGAPYGLSIVVPAIAGPFNLGTVVVRAAVNVDPIDAHVTVVSDDVPNLLDVTGDDGDVNGFPLRVRSIAVSIDRPGFMLAPTSCDPMAITGTLGSWEGTTAPVSSRFQVGNCSSLPVAPKLAIALTGKGQTTDDKHPGVHALLSQPAGQANLKKVTVSLPLSLALDPDNANGLCEFTDGSKVDPTCPKGSIVGTATARTPILRQPLTGPVYFVKNIRIDPKSGRQIKTLPKLVIPLTGENGLRLNVTGTSNVVDNHLVTTFDNLPDAPVSDFTLDIDGGSHGILVVSGTDICKATQIANQQINGQNGKQVVADVSLQTTACPLKVISKKVGKTSVAIKIGGLGAGKVTVTGKGIKKTSKTIASSTVATITAKRTKGKPGKIKVSFLLAGAKKAKTVTATLK